MKIEKVSSRQVIFLIIAFRIAIAFSYLPAINVPPGNQDSWIVLIVSYLYSTLVCSPLLFLGNRFSNLTLIQYMEKLFGKVVGKIIGLFYTIFFILGAVYFVSILSEIVRITMLAETPYWIITLFMILTCMYVASKGVEVLGRGAEFFVPIIISVIIGLVILGFNKLDFKVLLPIYKDSTFRQINIGAIDIAFKFTDVLILSMIIPNLENKKEINKIFFKSLFYSLSIVILAVVVSQTSLGIEQAKHANFPFFTFTRLIDIYRIIQRIESIYIMVWIISNVGKITGYLFFASLSISQVLNKNKPNTFIILISTITYIISLFLINRRTVLGVKQPIENITLILSVIAMFIIPLIALIVYFFRRKTLKDKEPIKN
ncbi:spore germination protein [Tissierella sp. MSJ-40]|uniref:Spore germination protein n=1 Tax=Tissierella simiarum TaxID=2841534 RepID=A0ABS6E992_9FIRM|nr:spore germination protein [Tissierella simiarum]